MFAISEFGFLRYFGLYTYRSSWKLLVRNLGFGLTKKRMNVVYLAYLVYAKAEDRGKYDCQHIPGYFLATSLTEWRLLVQYDSSSNLLAKNLTCISLSAKYAKQCRSSKSLLGKQQNALPIPYGSGTLVALSLVR